MTLDSLHGNSVAMVANADISADCAEETRSLRMRDLTSEAGLSRQAIHFYIDEGLLPPPHKKRRNSAVYSHEHLERLRWIQRLQREHFLSLNAIKSVLSGEDLEEFTPQQKALLRRVRAQLPDWARQTSTPVAQIGDVASNRVSEEDLAELQQAGLIEVHGSGEARTMSQDDSEIVECLARYREVGATRERGYRPAYLAIVDRAIEQMVEELTHVYARNWIGGSLADAVAFAEAVAPIDERLMTTLLRKKMRAVSARVSSGDNSAPKAPAKKAAKRKRPQ
ncbi:MAG: MerR family transcriptional regulator [Hyphomonadaceae bacterium]|nr:MerR family transcriptional regulator [Hyphomonadaceae bacterium]